MKFLVLLVAVLAIAQAERDWSQIKVRHLTRDANGRPFWGSRIVGGNEVVPHTVPHQCALFIDTPQGTFFCGATLIDVNYVLTAAHCADGANSIQVIMGAHNIRQNEPTQVTRTVTGSNIMVHEDWDPFNIQNDITLLRLDSPAPVNDNIKPLPLDPSLSGSLVGQTATVTGWGRPSDSAGGISEVLRTVDVPVMSNNDCNSIYGNIGPGIICIDSQGGKGSCNGDSGGPLTVNNNGHTAQCGIVSFGSAAGCEVGFPDAFTRVSYYMDWIQRHMN